MLLPLLLILLATGASAVIAYGTHPGLARHAHGLEMIMFTQRALWPLVILSLVACLILLGLVVANKRRAWWLLGLAPVLALFFHRFGPPGAPTMWIVDSPQFAAADDEPIPHNDWWVVGFVFGDKSYALPYWALYSTPVVFITDYDKRMVLLWSAQANCAAAFSISRELRARDWEIVSSPANSVLIYDQRLGDFIVTLTGSTVKGAKPIGFGQPIATTKTTWANWQKLHPNTRVLRGYEARNAPTGPILPSNTGTMVDGLAADARIALIGSTPPAAVPVDDSAKPLSNVVAGKTRLLVIRDPKTHRVRVFDRNAKEDLFPTFSLATTRNAKDKGALMTDSDSNSAWTADGKAIDGPLTGAQLKEYFVEEGLYWGVMKFWEPQIELAR